MIRYGSVDETAAPSRGEWSRPSLPRPRASVEDAAAAAARWQTA